MKVGITKARGFAYPDLTIVCGERQYFDSTRDVLMNPTVIFEVLSDSTRGFDAVGKLASYQKLESLRHYVLIEQDQRLVVHYRKNSDGAWLTEPLTAEDAVVPLEAAEIELPLSEIYAGVELEPKEAD